MSPGKQRWGGGAKERERGDRDRQLQREGKRGGDRENNFGGKKVYHCGTGCNQRVCLRVDCLK